MTDRDIRLLWLYMGEIWPTFTIPTDPDLLTIRTQVWQDTLGDLNQQTVRAALVALATSQYPPAVGAIRDKSNQLAGHQPAAPDVDEAWRAVYDRACNRAGDGDIWTHPAVQQTVRAIGFDHIRYSENVAIERAQFCRLYGVAQARHTRQQLTAAPAVAAFLETVPGIKRAEDVPELGRPT